MGLPTGKGEMVKKPSPRDPPLDLQDSRGEPEAAGGNASDRPWRTLWKAGLKGGSLTSVLARGASGSLAVTLLGSALAVGLEVLLARLLGADSFGAYRYTLAWVTLAVLGSRLGLETALVRFVASYRVAGRWGALRGLLAWSDRVTLAVATGGGLLGAVTVAVLGDRLRPELAACLWIGCALLPVLALLGLRQATLQGLRRVALAQVPELILRPLILALVVTALFLLGGRQPVASTAALGAALGATAGAVALAGRFRRRSLPPVVATAKPERHRREWLGVSLPLLLVAGMRRVMHQTDILLIGVFLGTTAAGVYAVATRLARLVALGLKAVNSITAPLISELHSRQESGKLQSMITLAAWGASLACLPACAVLILGRRQILGLFGEAFEGAAGPLVILALGQLINAWTGPVGWLLNMTGHQKVNARILAWITGLNVLLNPPAILVYGVEGAAVVTAGLLAIKNLWTWVEVRRRLGINASILSTWNSSPE